jgi:hypothetical protein
MRNDRTADEGMTSDPDHSEVEGWKAMFARLADQLAST